MNAAARPGKPVHFWTSDEVREGLDDLIDRIGWDLKKTGTLALALLGRIPPEIILEAARLAVIERGEPAEVMARMLRRGYEVEVGTAGACGEEVPMTEDQLRRLEAVEAAVERLGEGQEDIKSALNKLLPGAPKPTRKKRGGQ